MFSISFFFFFCNFLGFLPRVRCYNVTIVVDVVVDVVVVVVDVGVGLSSL